MRISILKLIYIHKDLLQVSLIHVANYIYVLN